jgi:hypothetical protein
MQGAALRPRREGRAHGLESDRRGYPLLRGIPVHPLHRLIGEIIAAAPIPDGKVILDAACGGKQNIQLFCADNATNRTRYCKVDAAVLKNNQVKVILEIEESDIRPVALCGKAFISALASYFIHRKVKYPMAERAFFVQVIDKSPDSKLDQCLYLSDSINTALLRLNTHLQGYQIFHGDVAEFEKPPAQEELREHLVQVCSV